MLMATIKRLQGTFNAFADCPKPVIAAIHGYCLGAGIDLITACDIRWSTADATFSVRETRLGLVADVGTMQRLPRIVGPGHVAELVYTGADIGAERALEIGLVSRVLPDEEGLHKEAMDLAEEIASNSPLVVEGAKAVLRAGEGRPIDQALDYMALWNAAFMISDDLHEAILAHAEKRPPRFTGA
jgi:enoyl-CoA hydratase